MSAGLPLASSVAPTLLHGHEVVLPIVGPLLVGALLIVLERVAPRWVPRVSLLAVALLLLLAGLLVRQASEGQVTPYLVGNWAAPHGIALVLDRLSALMLLVTATVGLLAVAYAAVSEPRPASPGGRHTHALFQFLLMGLNGAFLTADLFNLFVFFEVFLAASYGLLLHQANAPRLRAGVHYVVLNLSGSALFLVAVSLLYAVTGTLNMADLAQKLPRIAPENQALAQAGLLLLLLVFAMKAALLPLYFWLPFTYSSASAAVSALFAVLTKVGVYALLRATTLFVPAGLVSGASPLLAALAVATLVLGALAVLGAERLRPLVACLIVVSAGMLLLAVGLGSERAIAAGLFYLVPSTLVAAVCFLLADGIAAARGGSDLLQAGPRPARWGLLASAFFLAAVAVAGLPPLAGFLGKGLLLQAAWGSPHAAWVLPGVLLPSLMVMVALARAGGVLFWECGGPLPGDGRAPLQQPAWALAVTGLGLLVGLGLTAVAGPLSRYAHATAAQLLEPAAYVQAVLQAPVAPPAWDVRREMRERGDAQ